MYYLFGKFGVFKGDGWGVFVMFVNLVWYVWCFEMVWLFFLCIFLNVLLWMVVKFLLFFEFIVLREGNVCL